VVMKHLTMEERHAYGNMLLKLIEGLAKPRLVPGLVPVIHNKQEIKRRVTMIATFTKPGRMEVLVSIGIAAALCGIMFTRAAGNADEAGRKKPEAAGGAAKESEPKGKQMRGIEVLIRSLAKSNEEVKRAQRDVDDLRRQYDVSEFSPVGTFAHTTRNLEEQRIRVEAEYKGVAEVLNHLLALRKEKGNRELRNSILTVVNDEILVRLLQDLATTEATLTKLKQTYGPESPDVRSIAAVQADLDAKVDQRLEGILTGLRVKADSMKATADSLAKSADEARDKDAEMTEKYRPYFDARRRLDDQQKINDAILLRILQEAGDVEWPETPNRPTE
jgi:hypothetical protein